MIAKRHERRRAPIESTLFVHTIKTFVEVKTEFGNIPFEHPNRITIRDRHFFKRMVA